MCVANIVNRIRQVATIIDENTLIGVIHVKSKKVYHTQIAIFNVCRKDNQCYYI